MFDRLIVTEPEGANIKGRSRYFMVTSVVVGAAFLAAVVISIFAADFTLSNKGFEMVELIAPVDMPRPEPPRPRPEPQPQTSTPSTSKLPTRMDNIENLAVTPREIPPISTAPNTAKARPLDGRFKLDTFDSNPASTGVGRSTDTGTGTGSDGNGLGTDGTVAETRPDPIPPPPPVKQPEPVKKPPVVQSRGVINGMATNLPKPEYPAPAKVVGAKGAVSVQVLIDERGRVISANAVSGHPLLRSAAENAARNARFTPTLLSDTPVKVSGVIVYNFQRSS